MMTPAQSLETIAKLLERAIDVEASPALASLLVDSGRTHAINQAVRVRRAEARETFAAYPELEWGMRQ